MASTHEFLCFSQKVNFGCFFRILCKCSITLFRDSAGEAGTEQAGELAEQQAAVDMSMVSTGEQRVMISGRYITIKFVLNGFIGEDYVSCDLVSLIVTTETSGTSLL